MSYEEMVREADRLKYDAGGFDLDQDFFLMKEDDSEYFGEEEYEDEDLDYEDWNDDWRDDDYNDEEGDF